MSLSNLIKKISRIPGVAEICAFAGAFVFLSQALHFARIQETILDEGTYLVKGLLFVTGRYIPFQFDGPHTNQMPLSFLIPGTIQFLLENGLRTGRYFSIFLGLLILLGLWIVARRLGNRWWAAGIVWIVAINPAYANGYSMAVSQVLIACMLTWVMVLALDEKAHLWRLMLASVLASLMVLTRVNMAPVLPFLVVFIFWQFGWRAGLWSVLAGGLTLFAGHLVYWPGILQIWANQIPDSLFPFLDPWRFSDIGIKVWDPDPGWKERLDSFLDGLRFNFVSVAILSVFSVLIFHKKGWLNSFHYRANVFLIVLSAILFMAHGWAALLKNYCVYCFAGYLEFFSPVLVLVLILVYTSYRPKFARLYSMFVLLATLLLLFAAGYGSSRTIGPDLLDVPIPLWMTGKASAGTIPLWGLLENGLGIGYKTSRSLVPGVIGLLIGLALILASWLMVRYLSQRPARNGKQPQFWLILTTALIIAGVLLSPTRFMTGTASTYTCQADMLIAMEAVGEHLQIYIQPGKSVYWQGSLSAVPLLYIPEANIFPAQLNDGYSFRIGGEIHRLQEFGLWNEELMDQWLEQSDYIIIQEQYYNRDWKQFLESGEFDELPTSPAVNPCVKNSALRIFRREPNSAMIFHDPDNLCYPLTLSYQVQ